MLFYECENVSSCDKTAAAAASSLISFTSLGSFFFQSLALALPTSLCVKEAMKFTEILKPSANALPIGNGLARRRSIGKMDERFFRAEIWAIKLPCQITSAPVFNQTLCLCLTHLIALDGQIMLWWTTACTALLLLQWWKYLKRQLDCWVSSATPQWFVFWWNMGPSVKKKVTKATRGFRCVISERATTPGSTNGYQIALLVPKDKRFAQSSSTFYDEGRGLCFPMIFGVFSIVAWSILSDMNQFKKMILGLKLDYFHFYYSIIN